MEEVILEDHRVKLIPLNRELVKQLYHFSINEPEIWAFSLQSAAGKENMDNYFQAAVEAKKVGNSVTFLVYDKASESFAGSTRFYDYKAAHKTVMLGYTWYGKEFRGTGINFHCKYLLLEHAFENLELERVEFRADNNNERSKKAMKKIGVTEEGILRSDCSTPDGKRIDSAVFSILSSEWFDVIKSKIQLLIQS